MPTQVSLWKCNRCGNLFETEEHCKECEKIHSGEDNLRIVEVGKYQSAKRFPEKILVEDETYFGTMAEYTLKDSGSEDDYYEQKYWGGEN
jgi:ABC-type ATPase with predicted acetyltransferase domain